MTDNSFTSPMSMIEIDGAKIKMLRERQGLTQLYLATAVEVTTDTISRWENKRYPSIKRENGLKLAEALNVPLEEILQQPEEVPTESGSSGQDIPPLGEPLAEAHPPAWRSRWVVGLAALLVLVSLGGWYLFQRSASGSVTLERLLPPHCISGQPFPVVIRVAGMGDDSMALIVKENFPENGSVKATYPKLTAGALKNNQLKWLKKIDGTDFFAYLVSITGEEQQKVQFNGTVSIGNAAESPIGGNDSTVIDHYHWADSNRDNVISDDEILAVYEKYGDLKELDLDIELIEEIWMGSEYRWDPAKTTYKITD